MSSLILIIAIIINHKIGYAVFFLTFPWLASLLLITNRGRDLHGEFLIYREFGNKPVATAPRFIVVKGERKSEHMKTWQVILKSGKYVLLVLGLGLAFVSSVFATQKPLTFAMVPKGEHPYYAPCFEGFKAAAEKYGITPVYEAAPEFKIDQQIKIIEGLIARGVDGIAISALADQPLIPVVKEAMRRGIKVLTFDAQAPSTEALSYIGTDNEYAGYLGGKKLAALMHNTGKLAILQGGMAAVNLNLRRQGLEKALQEVAPQITIVTVEDTLSKFELAVEKAEIILERYPDVNAIFGVSAFEAPAAATVIKAQKKQGQVLVAGFDDLQETLVGIRDGSIQFCLVQKTYNMGWLSVENLLKAVNGEKIPQNIDTGILIVDKNTVDTYMDEMRQELKQ
jgi:ribose transport system substrate-binding protein